MFEWLVPANWAHNPNSSVEIQKKARYLLLTCFIVLVGLSLVTVIHFIFGASLLMVIGDAECYLTLFLALISIKKGRIELAANLLIGGLLISLFLQKVIGDWVVVEPQAYLRVYETLSILILFLLFWGLFALKDRQLLIYMVLAVIVLVSHFVVLVMRKYVEMPIPEDAWRALSVSLVVLITSGFISRMVLNLSQGLISLTEEKNKIIHQQNVQLEEKVAQRTHELESLNEDLRQFAYIASHDLKEPLRTIASFLGLVKMRIKPFIKEDEDLATYINFAIEGATRLNRLINDLLSYSRINAKPSGFVPVELDEVLNSALTHLNMMIGEHQVQISREILPQISGERVLLIQLFQNLLENAIKYAVPERIPHIQISANDRIATVEIRIQDNGEGIPLAYREQVFQIFQSVSTRKYAESTGIGLAICKKIVALHGGDIWVEGNEGEGSTFCFTLLK